MPQLRFWIHYALALVDVDDNVAAPAPAIGPHTHLLLVLPLHSVLSRSSGHSNIPAVDSMQ